MPLESWFAISSSPSCSVDGGGNCRMKCVMEEGGRHKREGDFGNWRLAN